MTGTISPRAASANSISKEVKFTTYSRFTGDDFEEAEWGYHLNGPKSSTNIASPDGKKSLRFILPLLSLRHDQPSA